jgi:hypothetical protein
MLGITRWTPWTELAGVHRDLDLMRPLVVVSVLFAVCAILATPAAAQSEQDRWMLNAQVGPAFGTFGTTPNFDAKAGYKFNEKISLVG